MKKNYKKPELFVYEMESSNVLNVSGMLDFLNPFYNDFYEEEAW